MSSWYKFAIDTPIIKIGNYVFSKKRKDTSYGKNIPVVGIVVGKNPNGLMIKWSSHKTEDVPINSIDVVQKDEYKRAEGLFVLQWSSESVRAGISPSSMFETEQEPLSFNRRNKRHAAGFGNLSGLSKFPPHIKADLFLQIRNHPDLVNELDEFSGIHKTMMGSYMATGSFANKKVNIKLGIHTGTITLGYFYKTLRSSKKRGCFAGQTWADIVSHITDPEKYDAEWDVEKKQASLVPLISKVPDVNKISEDKEYDERMDGAMTLARKYCAALLTRHT